MASRSFLRLRDVLAAFAIAISPVCLQQVCLGQGGPAEAANAGESASLEQLTAMLQSIDPYHPDQEVRGMVNVYGSTSMDAMAHGWASGFKQFHQKAMVEINAAGSDETFEALVKNPSSVGMLSRPVRDEELAELKRRGLKEPAAFVVAREALGVFVHASNPVQTISGEQLRAVFTQEQAATRLTWSLLDAPPHFATQPLRVISRTPNSGTQRFLADFVFNASDLRDGVSEHVSNAEVLKAVSDDPLSIAICGLRSTGQSVKSLKLMAGATEVPSDDHAVLTGQYPLTRPMTIILDLGQTDAEAKASQEFVHYGMCQAGQAGAVLVGFFPVDLPLLRAGVQKLGTSHFR